MSAFSKQRFTSEATVGDRVVLLLRSGDEAIGELVAVTDSQVILYNLNGKARFPFAWITAWDTINVDVPEDPQVAPVASDTGEIENAKAIDMPVTSESVQCEPESSQPEIEAGTNGAMSPECPDLITSEYLDYTNGGVEPLVPVVNPEAPNSASDHSIEAASLVSEIGIQFKIAASTVRIEIEPPVFSLEEGRCADYRQLKHELDWLKNKWDHAHKVRELSRLVSVCSELAERIKRSSDPDVLQYDLGCVAFGVGDLGTAMTAFRHSVLLEAWSKSRPFHAF